MYLLRNSFLKFIIVLFFLVGCSDADDNVNTPINQNTIGSGVFEYEYNTTGFSKMLNVFYHIPLNSNSSSSILFVFHGANRNANDYRNALINFANEKNFIVIAPEFSAENFSGGDKYNLGNVYIDGDNPSENTLNPENEWTFSMVEPLFDLVKLSLNNLNNSYKIIGHSAGAQFAQRFLMFKPNNKASETVISAAGWYTFLDLSVNFPYGFKNSILNTNSAEILLAKTIFIQVGENDNDPNASGLRRNQQADALGNNRLDRAISFFNQGEQYSTANNYTFNWSFNLVENADHAYILALENAVNLLYD